MSRPLRTRLAPIAAVVWLAAGPASFAQAPSEQAADEAEAAGVPKSPWRFDSNSWIWLMGIEGDVGVGGSEVEIDASFGDIVDAADSIFAFSGRLEVGYGPVAGFVDGLYADLGADDESGPLGLADVDIEFQQAIVDFGLMYRVVDWEPPGEAAKNHRNLTLDAYAGARYIDLEIDLDVNVPAIVPDQSGGKDWFDPIVGAKLVAPVSERFYLMVSGDVGGLGAESDLTWSATGVGGFDFRLFRLRASVLGGYRAIGWDFSDGSGTDKFTWDLVQHGPIIGFSLRF